MLHSEALVLLVIKGAVALEGNRDSLARPRRPWPPQTQRCHEPPPEIAERSGGSAAGPSRSSPRCNTGYRRSGLATSLSLLCWVASLRRDYFLSYTIFYPLVIRLFWVVWSMQFKDIPAQIIPNSLVRFYYSALRVIECEVSIILQWVRWFVSKASSAVCEYVGYAECWLQGLARLGLAQIKQIHLFNTRE